MAFKEITYDVDAGRAYVRFNRPEKLNALTPLLLEELNEALWEADDDRRVHAVCVSGTGRCFSAGYDLGGAARAAEGVDRRRRPPSPQRRHLRRRHLVPRAGPAPAVVLFDMHKPVIAKGPRLLPRRWHRHRPPDRHGIAADDAQIGFPPRPRPRRAAEPHVALPLRATVGEAADADGDTITGRGAAKIGLVMKAVPVDLLDREVDGPEPAGVDRPRPAGRQQADRQPRAGAHGRPHAAAPGGRDRRPRHVAPGAHEFMQSLRDLGVREAVRARRQFPDGQVRVDAPRSATPTGGSSTSRDRRRSRGRPERDGRPRVLQRQLRPQHAAASVAYPYLEAAAGAVPAPLARTPFTIGDFGCAGGANEMEPMAGAVATLRHRGVGGPIEVVHTDLPENDFTPLFELLGTAASYTTGQTGLYPMVVGRTLYGPLPIAASTSVGRASPCTG